MKITNDGQFSNLYKGTISFPYSPSVNKSIADYSVNSKPLTSKSWVTVNKRSKGQRAKDSVGASYYLKKIGNLYIDIDKPKESDVVKAQRELMAKLKAEYLAKKTREQNKKLLQKAKIQRVYQDVNGVTVHYDKISNIEQYKRVV